MKVNLSIQETALLNKNAETRKIVQPLLLKQSKKTNGVEFTLTSDEADKIRNACSDLLEIIGFDKDYATTNEGRILEGLIDKFFVASHEGHSKES